MIIRLTNHSWPVFLLSFVLAASWLVLEPARPRAQTAAQQVIDDAASALGGRQRVLAVKTLQLEGGGHNLEIDQGLRWDDLGLQSDVSQISDGASIQFVGGVG